VAKATLLWLYAVGYTMDTMYFTWLDNPVDVDKDLQLPQFFLVDTPKFDCSQNYTAGTARRPVSVSVASLSTSRLSSVDALLMS